MGTQFTGISRKTEYSPNHVVNDALILQATADALRARGAAVQVLSEDRVGLDSIPDGVVFSMVQGPVAAGRLSAIERDRGLLVVNSPRAVMNCYRTEMIRLLPEHGVPFPRSVLLNLGGEEGPSPAVEGQRLWLKRGDVHAVHREDVVLTHHGEERRFLLCEFRNRGIGQAVLQEHLEGDTVKFYALRDSDFFHWYYPNGA